ncbi:MAG TPA: hypothetical protein VMB84_07290 [Stellaceae bacterium]|nr:hypothetical protein [Stellaceae bacterium]
MISKAALAAVAALALLAVPARADITVKSQDGSLELTLPNGWHEAPGDQAGAKLVGTDGHGARIIVRVHSKEDFKDIKALATYVVGRLKLQDGEPKTEDIQMNGKPAIRTVVVGTEPEGIRLGFVITIFESDGNYYVVTGRAPASQFGKDEAILAGLAGQLKVAPVAPASAPPAPAKPPARR